MRFLSAALSQPATIALSSSSSSRFPPSSSPASLTRSLALKSASGFLYKNAPAVKGMFLLTLNAATLSIDDFYLTAEEQAKLRSENQGNALLEFRGNAGSHDLQFSVDMLSELGKLTKEGMKAKLPQYDKSAYGGRGDRADPSTWPGVEGPLSVILFEGWMLGFKPLPNEVVKAVDPQLEVVNKNKNNDNNN